MVAFASQEVGGFPCRTITEDFALGMELNKKGWETKYLPEYLAIGRRNALQVCRRWQ